MRILRSVLLFVLAGVACANTIFYDVGILDTDGTTKIAWIGSSTAFSGFYRWPAGRKPLSRFNGPSAKGGQLVAEPDFTLASCDPATSRCSVSLRPFFGRRLENGGLPDRTEVKFVTTGALPGGLVGWEEDQTKSYYIRDWNGTSFRVAETPGGPPIAITRKPGSGSHGMTFAGYSHVMSFGVTRGVPFTCDPETDVCTSATPHRRMDTQHVGLHSTGNLPAGIPPQLFGGLRRSYCLEVLDAKTFRIQSTADGESLKCGKVPSARVVDITDQGTGTHYMYSSAGTGNARAEYGASALWSITGFPQGTVLSFRLGAEPAKPIAWNPGPDGSARPMAASSSMYTTVVAKIPAVTPANQYPVTIQTSESRTSLVDPSEYKFKLKVVPIAAAKTTEVSKFPPIPGYKQGSSVLSKGECGNYMGVGDCSWATWEYMLTANIRGGGSAAGTGPSVDSTAGFRRCTNREDPEFPQGMERNKPTEGYGIGFTGLESKVWYYNDETFFKIAQYTGDPTWANCGLYIARAMRDRFLDKGPNVRGNLYFPWMLVAAHRWTKDPTFREAAIRIADAGTYAWGSVSDFNIREHAYAFERRLARRALTGEEDYDLEQFADAAIGMMYINAVGAPERRFQQPFMTGLLARPLTRWYAISRDERVPYVFKLWMDKAWSNWFFSEPRRTAGGRMAAGFLYNPEPNGARCNVTCESTIGSLLNNLIAPMWAWYWRLTGDETYRTQGDTIFSRQFRDGYPYHAKEWSQTYYWSWDYVDWRSGKPVF